jgi:hypothetical protein
MTSCELSGFGVNPNSQTNFRAPPRPHATRRRAFLWHAQVDYILREPG